MALQHCALSIAQLQFVFLAQPQLQGTADAGVELRPHPHPWLTAMSMPHYAPSMHSCMYAQRMLQASGKHSQIGQHAVLPRPLAVEWIPAVCQPGAEVHKIEGAVLPLAPVGGWKKEMGCCISAKALHLCLS